MDPKYGSLWGGWCSLEHARAFEVGLWKNIKKGWENFSSFTRFQVGDGFGINFWHDHWCGEAALKIVFLVLYGLACAKDANIAANLEFLDGYN